jgi:hypothetical protein
MIRLRRASVIVAFSLLTSAATAYAECAWVLWGEEVTKECDRPGVNPSRGAIALSVLRDW